MTLDHDALLAVVLEIRERTGPGPAFDAAVQRLAGLIGGGGAPAAGRERR